jgi:predicted phage terminase large subunit-like protein
MGFNYGIIDDPIKNRQEANSPTYRNATWEWFTSTFFTRQEKDAGILVTLTRYHEDDLAGRILELAGDEWVVLNLPAIAEGVLHEGDPRELGEALWPEKYNLNKLERIRSTIGEYEWGAQYQQSPLPPGGGLFDTLKITDIVDYVPECTQVVRFYDLAVTAKKTSDYTVGVKMGITSDERPVILDVFRAQKTMPEIQEAIVQNAILDGTAVRIRLEAEKAGIVQLAYLLRDSRMRPYTVDMKPPLGDKYTRATPFASRVNAGRIMMVKAGWNRAFLDELSVFTGKGDAHDDQVDACSGAYDMLVGKSFFMTTDPSDEP